MAVVQNYIPGDSLLIDKIVCELKSQGIFDEFRKECIADVDTKPAYQNLRQRVEGSVSGFLNKQTWNPDINKNHARELLRKNIYESGFLEIGVERIVDQVVNPKINSVFLPKVAEVVYKFLGIERPNSDRNKLDDAKYRTDAKNLLPTDLEAVSPESETLEKKHDKSNDSHNLDDSKIDEDESPPFEPIEEQTTYLPNEENSVDSHLSGFSGLLSHDSSQSQDINKPMQLETSNQDSILSKHSSDGHLSIVMSDDTDMKMEFCEDSRQSKSSKTNDSNSKTFDFNLENSSRSSSSKAEKKSEHKAEDKAKTEKGKSYDKHKSSKNQSKDRKEDKERKSDHDKKESKEKYSSKSREKTKDGKDYKSSKSSSKADKDRDSKSEKDVKSDKDRDSKTESKSEKNKSCNGSSHHRNSTSSNSSKDKSGSRKESTSKDGTGKDKSKASSSRGHRDSKSKEEKDKSQSKPDSKSDKSKKDGKHDRHHSKSDKHGSSSKNKDKNKKDGKKDKKENKDDHFSSKKRSDRRSTDRDSNDGQSGLKSSSSSFDSYFSSQTQSKSQESSNSNSNTGSGDSGASDAVEGDTVNLKTPITFVSDAIETVGELYINAEVQQPLPRIKLIKPKFASNIHEARKLMKIRRQLSKIEQQNVLQFSKALYNKETYVVETDIAKGEGAVEVANNRKENEEENAKKNTNSRLQIEIPNHGCVPEEKTNEISPPLKSSVVSAASWDALEAKFNQNIDYSTYYDDPDTPEKINEPIININTNANDCFYFNDDVLPATERYIVFIAALIERLKQQIAHFGQEETTKQNNVHDTPPPQTDVQKTDRGNGLKFSRKTLKRKLMEYSDAKNNNKKFNNHHIEAHENFSLPLSPAESDISVDKNVSDKPLKKDEVELSVKLKKNNITSAKRQRYSSEDLYKPRPLFSGSRRRARNLELD